MTNVQSPAERYVEQIEAQIDELARIIAATTDERWTRKQAEGDWTAAEVCGHLVEMMPYWAARAREVAATPGTHFGRDESDTERLGGVAEGATLDRHATVERLRAAAAAACRDIHALSPDGWGREGINATRGPMTVEQIIAGLLAGHLEGHVEQVRRAVGHGERA